MTIAAKVLYALSLASMPSYQAPSTDVEFYNDTSNRKGGRKFTRKPSGAAALKRAAAKRNNIRKFNK